MHTLRYFSFLALTPFVFANAAACSGSEFTLTTSPDGSADTSTTDSGEDSGGGSDACAPIPCPVGAPWDSKKCACVLEDSGTIEDTGVDAKIGCTSDTDCLSIEKCGYRVSDGCNAIGMCVPYSPPGCGAVSAACACDNTAIVTGCTGYPSGYASKPYLHAGACK